MGDAKRSSAGLRGFAAFGTALLVAGFLAARAFLPEWTSTAYSGVECIKTATRDLALAGATLSSPKIATRTRTSAGVLVERAFRRLGVEAPTALRVLGAPVGPVIEGTLAMPGAAPGPVTIALDPDGRIMRLDWLPGGQAVEFATPDDKTRAARKAMSESLSKVLLFPGDELLEEREYPLGNTTAIVRPIRSATPGRPAESLVRLVVPNALVSLSRELEDPEAGSFLAPAGEVSGQLAKAIPALLLAFGTAILFAILLFRRRISFRAGLFLGAGIGVSMLLGGLSGDPSSSGAITGAIVMLTYLVVGAFAVILWTVAESLLRDAVPNFTTSLDAFSYGRLLPRGGRALLAGLAGGAAFLGVSLLVPALAARFAPHLGPTDVTFRLALFQGPRSPFFEGVYDSASFVLLFALLRFRLDRVAWLLTIGLWGLWISTALPVHSALALPLGLALATILGFVFR
ncbi:MAG: hypothetical protein JNK60_12595, partial [Acidobacteria bacterium]|nr:hypothetical protein [Acidobacteriota bacterium]